jgi:hypothetical protein
MIACSERREDMSSVRHMFDTFSINIGEQAGSAIFLDSVVSHRLLEIIPPARERNTYASAEQWLSTASSTFPGDALCLNIA